MVGDVFYVGDLKTTQTFGFRATDGKPVFHPRDGAYNPVISDGRRLYMTGYQVIYALKPRARRVACTALSRRSREPRGRLT